MEIKVGDIIVFNKSVMDYNEDTLINKHEIGKVSKIYYDHECNQRIIVNIDNKLELLPIDADFSVVPVELDLSASIKSDFIYDEVKINQSVESNPKVEHVLSKSIDNIIKSLEEIKNFLNNKH